MAGGAATRVLLEESKLPRNHANRFSFTTPCCCSTFCFMPARRWCECCFRSQPCRLYSILLHPYSPQFRWLLYLAPRRSVHMALPRTQCRQIRPLLPRICRLRQRQEQQLTLQHFSGDAGEGHARAFADELDGAHREHLSGQHCLRVCCGGAPPASCCFSVCDLRSVRMKAMALIRRCVR